MLDPRPTTLIESVRLSAHVGATVVIASETFQWTGSFKFRAASNVVRAVPHPAVITASSGNFGQAIAFACQLARKRCTVVMPANSASVKIDAVRAYGGTVDLVDTAVVRRDARVAQLASADPAAYVASAFDDALVIAGNATLGRELAVLNAHAGPGATRWDAIIAPIGGGGLGAGLVSGLADAGDNTPVWAAEPAMANDFARSMAAGRLVANSREPQTIADGVRTLSVGVRNWEILRARIAGTIEMSEAHIRDAVRLCFVLANLKVEPTGALSIAALLAEPSRFRGRRVCCVVSGGNVDPEVFCEILGGH